MDILSRNYIISRFKTVSTDIIFIPEHDLPTGITLEYFVQVDPIHVINKSIFWEWCSMHLFGWVRCISSGEFEEIWGFTDQRDINFFVLRWT